MSPILFQIAGVVGFIFLVPLITLTTNSFGMLLKSIHICALTTSWGSFSFSDAARVLVAAFILGLLVILWGGLAAVYAVNFLDVVDSIHNSVIPRLQTGISWNMVQQALVGFSLLFIMEPQMEILWIRILNYKKSDTDTKLIVFRITSPTTDAESGCRSDSGIGLMSSKRIRFRKNITACGVVILIIVSMINLAI